MPWCAGTVATARGPPSNGWHTPGASPDAVCHAQRSQTHAHARVSRWVLLPIVPHQGCWLDSPLLALPLQALESLQAPGCGVSGFRPFLFSRARSRRHCHAASCRAHKAPASAPCLPDAPRRTVPCRQVWLSTDLFPLLSKNLAKALAGRGGQVYNLYRKKKSPARYFRRLARAGVERSGMFATIREFTELGCVPARFFACTTPTRARV